MSRSENGGRNLFALLSLTVAAIGLLIAARAEGRSHLAPLIGLILPTVRWVASAGYRERVRHALAARWSEAARFADGSNEIPWRAALELVVIPFFLLDLAQGQMLGAVDTRPVLPTAIRLVRHGDFDLAEYGRNGRPEILLDGQGRLLPCFQKTERGIYSAFPPGMLPFAVAVVGPARVVGANLDAKIVHFRLEKLAAALVAALVLGLFFVASLRLGPPAAAAVATALLATSSAVLTTIGMGMWQHGGVAFWSLMILVIELRAAGHPRRWGVVLQGIACGMLLTCRPTAAILVVGLGLWVLLRAPLRAFAMAGVAVLVYLPCLVLYRSLYGSILGPATIAMNASGQYWHLRPETFFGVLISPARGLFVYQPWLILAALGLIPALRRRSKGRVVPAGFTLLILSVSLAHTILIAAWHDWSGGYCWGSRLLTEIIPLLGLLTVRPIAGLMTLKSGRCLILGLALLGTLTHLPALFLNAARWNYTTDHDRDLWSWTNAPFLYRSR